MEIENVYFLDTPVEVQEECYDYVHNEIYNLDLPPHVYVYLVFSSIANIAGKYCFNVYVKNGILDKNETLKTPDFLIFVPNV